MSAPAGNTGKWVTIFEVGARDGLQNEKVMIPTADKVALVNLLSETGLSKIEAASFVSPKWVPQMADSAEVMAGIHRAAGVSYAALTPNVKGYERARDAGVDEVAVFASASEGFSQRNINCSVAESIERFTELMVLAGQDGMPVRGYVSCVVACPYDGVVEPSAVADVVKQLLDAGCYEVSLGDTIGAGEPDSIAAMLDAVLQVTTADKLAGHYHDTGEKALANIRVSLDKGLRTFDSAVGGLGGCPYAPGAKGNVSSNAVVAMLHESGYETGIDEAKLAEASRFVEALKGRLS
ncbi:MAG: hydroxymethylglutaryl-CoA lyase [Proteobacteria bacterium]|nr:MAG: hydroxymethylglutaryl-CoA lyase [Pseudomonadota bacterium]